jgi:pimeloyl-ACP methyl ester carboxylesterase
MGQGPGVVFLGGFRSDMEGTKALHLDDRTAREGRAFLRFDYSGHGQSGGAFEDGTIGQWFEDARAALALADGPQILVGSSMGGWIALLLARAAPERIAGLVTVAAAPDFTEDLMWSGFDAETRATLLRDGRLERPSAYADAPDVITRALIEDGRNWLVLREPLLLPAPARFLQGTADADVPPGVSLALLDHATGPDLRLTLVKGADHRFSTPECLALVEHSVAELCQLAKVQQ